MDEETFEKTKKAKERENAELRINLVISSMRKKMILIIVGSLILTYVTYTASILLIEVASFFVAIWFSFYLFTDFSRYSADALNDWKELLENEEEFWKKHKKLTSFHWK